jgi:glycosyltransferase involved in cell wall biosynthesis
VAWLTAIVPCKGRLEHLKQSLPTLVAQGEDLDIVVVDYDCPDGTAAWVREAYPAVRVVKVDDRPIYNRSAARNVGAAEAATDWLAFLDADVLVGETLVAALKSRVQPGFFYIVDPRPPTLWGALVVSRADFVWVDRYDETFEGWGSEDVDILERLLIIGRREGTFPGELLASIPHDDSLRHRFHAPTDLVLNAQINLFYRVAKNDLLRHDVALDIDGRRKLYDDVRRTLEAPGGARTFQVGYRQETLGGLGITSVLRYDLDPNRWR